MIKQRVCQSFDLRGGLGAGVRVAGRAEAGHTELSGFDSQYSGS